MKRSDEKMTKSISMKEIIQLLKQYNQFLGFMANNEMNHSKLMTSVFEQIHFDSRKVVENTLFICKGINFQSDYLIQAIHAGATGFVMEEKQRKELDMTLEIPGILVKHSQKAMALIAMHFYDYPQKKLRIIGVTGTKGKTTTSFFIKRILDQQNGNKTALFSTVFTDVGLGQTPAELTTPESLDLYRLMDQAVGKGYQDLVMEVSSQAYLMQRVYQLEYDLGIFLNISPDHIGENEHVDFADYLKHKLKIFKHSKAVVIHTDTLALSEIKKTAEESTPNVIWAGEAEGVAGTNYSLAKVEHQAESVQFQIVEKKLFEAEQRRLATRFCLNIVGAVNLENALVAIAATRYLGCSEAEIKAGLASAKVPGRMEIIPHKEAMIIVDYAHNAISLQKLLMWTKARYPDGQQIVVFGCPGNKGFSRRQDLGETAAQLADYVILTEDDPGFEDPRAICEEIGSHLNGFVSYEFILNREAAITKALKRVQAGDVLLVVGKGSDAFQLRNGVRESYVTDSQVIKDQLQFVL